MQHLSDPNSIVESHLFNRIRILDSTSFNLPSTYQTYEGAGGTGVKIQLEYELYEGIFRHIQIQNGKENDSTYAKSIKEDIEPGDLCLRDLGYFSQRNLLDINEQGGYYVSRIKTDTYLYQQNEKGQWEKTDVLKRMEPLQPGEIMEFPEVRIGMETKDPLITRVIVAKLTEEQKEKRREQLNKKKRKGKSSLSAQKNISITILATNITQEMVEKEEIYPLYSLRWQIEILFKTWKSLFDLEKVKEMKQERFECHLYGKLIQMLVYSTMAFQCRRMLYQRYQMEASEYKSVDLVMEGLEGCVGVMITRGKQLVETFRRIYKSIQKNGKKCHKQKKKTVFDILHIVYEKNFTVVA